MKIGTTTDYEIYFGESLIDGPLGEMSKRVTFIKTRDGVKKLTEFNRATAGVCVCEGALEVWIREKPVP